MSTFREITVAAALSVGALLATFAHAAGDHVLLQTSKGPIEIELYPDKAPVTVANFLKYVDAGFYDGVIFHRVIDGFMVQTGGFDAKLTQRAGEAPIVNESKNGLKNVVGTVAMARTNAPDSATSQFYINVADNPSLDYRPGHPGYTVFGKVVAGIDVVGAIAQVKTGSAGNMQDVPLQPVVIESAKRIKK
jgi:peptidyl-prolyl cis-trans isomerase A (cyclophilin A)